MTTHEHIALIRSVSKRLFLSLAVLLPVLAALAIQPWRSSNERDHDVVFLVFGFGALGAFVSLQRRLKALMEDDLLLLSSSWLYALLIPLIGGVLAMVLYCLFLSGLVTGELFPEFCENYLERTKESGGTKTSGLSILFECSANGPRDYAKLIFWSFLAGFSEKFVIDILGRFDIHDISSGRVIVHLPPTDKS